MIKWEIGYFLYCSWVSLLIFELPDPQSASSSECCHGWEVSPWACCKLSSFGSFASSPEHWLRLSSLWLLYPSADKPGAVLVWWKTDGFSALCVWLYLAGSWKKAGCERDSPLPRRSESYYLCLGHQVGEAGDTTVDKCHQVHHHHLKTNQSYNVLLQYYMIQ